MILAGQTHLLLLLRRINAKIEEEKKWFFVPLPEASNVLNILERKVNISDVGTGDPASAN